MLMITTFKAHNLDTNNVSKSDRTSLFPVGNNCIDHKQIEQASLMLHIGFNYTKLKIRTGWDMPGQSHFDIR